MRKEIEITIEDGRDAGKLFRVTEMPVSRLEKWACRALIALFGAELPPDVASLAQTSNAMALASGVMRGISGLDWKVAEPLYDELLAQIAIIPRRERPLDTIQICPQNLDAHIEDLSTIFRLRLEVVALSLNFGEGGEGLTSRLFTTLAQQDCGATSTSAPA